MERVVEDRHIVSDLLQRRVNGVDHGVGDIAHRLQRCVRPEQSPGSVQGAAGHAAEQAVDRGGDGGEETPRARRSRTTQVADDAGDAAEQAAGSAGHRADIAEDGGQRPESLTAQEGTGQGRRVGQQVSGLAQMAEAECLAEIGQAVDGPVQQRDLVPEVLEGHVDVEDGGVREVRDRGEKAARREQAAGGRGARDGGDQRVGRSENGTEIREDRTGRGEAAATQNRPRHGERVRQEIACRADVTEADRLAEAGEGVNRRVEHRDLVAGILKRRVQVEDGLV